ncbi:MAG: MBL fold metallo-hydrolase [Christensenellaceae bacterium]
MSKLYVLGTGHALVTEIYNSCFALEENGDFFFLDAGGGNGVLSVMKKMEISLKRVRALFISHEHIDHLLGSVWIVRAVADAMIRGEYQGDFSIYAEIKLLEKLKTICELTLRGLETALFGIRILLCPVSDGQKAHILSYETQFFNVRSPQLTQFGCKIWLPSGKTISYMGDEPFHEENWKYVFKSNWLIAEALCMEKDKDIYKPHRISHGTVKDTCVAARSLEVENLVLTHTEDTHGEMRKVLYTTEGKEYYLGNLFIPNDREIIEL